LRQSRANLTGRRRLRIGRCCAQIYKPVQRCPAIRAIGRRP
jgi:hypothetical protein